jgi:hypothetical protein
MYPHSVSRPRRTYSASVSRCAAQEPSLRAAGTTRTGCRGIQTDGVCPLRDFSIYYQFAVDWRLRSRLALSTREPHAQGHLLVCGSAVPNALSSRVNRDHPASSPIVCETLLLKESSASTATHTIQTTSTSQCPLTLNAFSPKGSPAKTPRHVGQRRETRLSSYRAFHPMYVYVHRTLALVLQPP